LPNIFNSRQLSLDTNNYRAYIVVVKRQKTHTRKVLKLRSLRRSREMTQAELARRSGLSIPTVCEIETGKTKPSLESARALAAVFDVSVEEAFSHVEVPA
jgi:DNA-binding XRE family transcriptional regulator